MKIFSVTNRAGKTIIAGVISVAWAWWAGVAPAGEAANGPVIAKKSVQAAPPKPASGPSDLDRKLLEGLGDDLLDDLPSLGPAEKKPVPKATDEKPATEQPPGEQQPGADQPTTEKPSPLPGEDIGQAGESDNPLVRIGREMRGVEQRIAKQDASDQTQQLQRQIVTELAELIKQAQQSNSQSQSSSQQQQKSRRSQVRQADQKTGQQPGDGNGKTAQRPAKNSSERLGPDETREVDMDQMRDLIKDVWGNLPERLREQMNQDAVEEFLPKYRIQIEEYFRRLAEEEAAGR